MPATGQLPTKGTADAVALLPTTTDAVAHSVNGTTFWLTRPPNGFVCELNVTAAALAVGDTLDVWIQTMFDTTTWVDVVHFAQVLGNGGVKRYFDKIVAQGAQAEFEIGAALAASSTRAIMGDQWRVRYTIADGGAHGQSFTFAVWIVPM